MARKLRLVFPGACYHVLNRGNYRADIFATVGAANAFLTTLFEATARAGWRLHAFVIMRNHYHLAITTPDPNLVAGMQWLQATFAARFNRFRRVQGHLFQGRYKAILIEPGAALSRVVDYIHLNPVRAKAVPPDGLLRYRWSSLPLFAAAAQRPTGLVAEGWLNTLARVDESKTWSWYLRRLAHLGADDSRQQREGLSGLSLGWAIGTTAWRKAIAEEHAHLALDPSFNVQEVRELREQQWKATLYDGLRRRRKGAADIATDPKGALWKVAVAKELRERVLAPNAWIAQQLNMGHPGAVSSYLSRARRLGQHAPVAGTAEPLRPVGGRPRSSRR